jgi:mannan endo-1,4-beta-mannosidase
VLIRRRHPLAAALVAAALLFCTFLALASEQANAKNVRTGLSAARKLAKPDRCTRNIPARRARTMSRWQRRQLIRRRQRGCQATQSSGPGAPLYWGATIGDQITGEQAPWDMGAVSSFEGMAGKGVSLVNFFAPFANCSGSRCSYYKFPGGVMEDIREHGSIPVFSWSSQSIPSSLNEPDFQLADVIAGTYDSFIREFAEDARDWGHPFFLRFNWEMNGTWFPWSEGVNGNQPGEFVAAWRHVHDIFSSVGADNVSWVWCPNVDPAHKLGDLASNYPGAEYVDWTGLDGYNWGPVKGGWTSFSKLYDTTYHEITDTIAPGKPLMIGEMGSTENGGSKASWISEALAEIPTAFPNIRAMLWFDTFDDGMDWPIETSTSAAGAFAAGVQSPAYQSNAYADLPAGAIAPPA